MDLEAELVDHIDRGDIQKVFECIYKGVCLNVSVQNPSDNETETTPLLQAITSNISAKLSLSLAQILLLHGADPDVVAGGRVPLLEAVKLDRLEVVRLLLESGVNKVVCDEKGEDALSYARNSEHDDIQLLLLGQETKVSITFNGYVFEDMETTKNQELDKENNVNIEPIVNTPSASNVKAPTDFLLEVEKIFEKDIIGTPSGATLTRQDISPVKRDMDEVAGMLQDVGFRTPRSYSAKATPVPLSSQTLSEFNSPIPKQENQGFKEKVEQYLQSLENTSFDSISLDKSKTRSDKISASSDSSQEQQNNDGFTTPKIPKKSYLRQTVASSAKKRIPLDPPSSADKRKAKDQKPEGSNKKKKRKG